MVFYNQRGKAEQYIKEGTNAIKWTRLSCRKFRDNGELAPPGRAPVTAERREPMEMMLSRRS